MALAWLAVLGVAVGTRLLQEWIERRRRRPPLDVDAHAALERRHDLARTRATR